MLYIDIPTQAELHTLALTRTPAAVSIYLPTTPVSGEISGDRIVLKNLAKEAVTQLEEAGHDKREIATIADHLENLVEDDNFWRFQAHSLAIFVTPSTVKTFRVPNALHAQAEVADRFCLIPLLRAVTFPQTAYLLALAEGSVRVFEIAAGLPIALVAVPDLPANITEALHQPSTGVRDESRANSAAGQRSRQTEFARSVDRALRGLLSGHHVPLLLIADGTLGAHYRSINSYPHLMPEGLNRTPEKMNELEIADAVRPLLDHISAAETAAFRDLYATRGSSGRAIADVAQTARAATMGAIATLLVDIDAHVPGLIDEETGEVALAENETATNYNVVDEITRRALLAGARVLAVRAEDLPTAAPLAAILRYAV